MKLYKITIALEREGSPDERGYRSWDDIYEQIIDDLPIAELVTIINRPRTVSIQERFGALIAGNQA